MSRFFLIITLSLSLINGYAQDSLKKISFHFQTTFVDQYHPSFKSSVSRGGKSLDKASENDLSSISTLYFGVKLFKFTEVYMNPEIAGGSGFSGATGVAGFPNGTTFRVGSPAPTLYMARLFLRQTIPLTKTISFLCPSFISQFTTKPTLP